MSEPQYVMAIDQGTTSTRAIVFDHSGKIKGLGQYEHEQIFRARAGWSTTPRRSGATPAAAWRTRSPRPS